MSTPADDPDRSPGTPVADREQPAGPFTTEPPYPPSSASYVPGYPPPFPPRRPATGQHLRVWLFLAALLFAFLLLLVGGGQTEAGDEMRLFAVSGLESLPFLPLTLFAYLGRRTEWARVLTSLYWMLLVGMLALFLWMFTLEGLAGPEWLRAMSAGQKPHGGLPALSTLARAGASAFGIGFAVLVGLLAFLPTVRRAAATLLPIDPESFVHATALATVSALTVMAFVPLTALGEPPLLILVTAADPSKGAGGIGEDAELRSTIYTFFWLVPGTILAVGYPIQRTFREALQRVGLVRPKAWQVLLGVVLVPVFVGAMELVDKGMARFWSDQGWPTTDGKAFEEMMKFAINPIGAIVIGVTAGLGEELSVRGVLQPRLGILLSNLFFTSLHALQYSWDGLLSVFLIGLALGVLRKYTNTTTSAIVHGGYDFVLVLLAAHEAASS